MTLMKSARALARVLRMNVRDFVRTSNLSYQMWRIESLVADFDQAQRRKLAFAFARDMRAASACTEPVFYQSRTRRRNRSWGDGTRLGWTRTRSGNFEVQVCGVALWLTVAYHETGGSGDPASQSIHRRIIRISRELREFLEKPGSRKERGEEVFATHRLVAGA